MSGRTCLRGERILGLRSLDSLKERLISDTMEENTGDVKCEVILDHVDVNTGGIDLRLYQSTTVVFRGPIPHPIKRII